MGFTPKQQQQIDKATHVLQGDEQVLDVTTGLIQVTRMGSVTQRSGQVLVTDRRVILYTKKLGGYEMNDFVYGLLTGLDYKKGMMLGNMAFLAAGDRTHIQNIPKDDVERVAKAIRERMAGAHVQGNGSALPTSAADEIRKLATLRDEGLLTEAEFTAKNAQILGL